MGLAKSYLFGQTITTYGNVPVSLRLNLIRTITIVLFCTLVLGGVLIYWHAVRKIEIEMQAAIAVGGRIAHNAIDDVEEVKAPLKRLQLMVADFDGDRHLRARFVNSGNRTVWTSKWQPPESSAPEWLFRLLTKKPHTIAVTLPPSMRHLGHFILETDAHNEVAEVWADAKLYLALLSLFCLSTLVVLYYALGRALKPLQELLDGFAEIGSGDYRAQLSIDKPAELAKLSTGFNHMALRLVEMQERNNRLREQLETLQEEERAELARNLHDEVSPLLFSTDVDATTITQMADSGEATKIRERAQSIKSAVALMKRNVKSILMQLRPGGLHALSLKSTIEDLTAFWTARHPELTIAVDVPAKSWGVKIDSAVQSIIRESLSNAMKHARPTRVEVEVLETEDGYLDISVSDNGGGMREPTSNDGLGLIGMRERASLLGGSLTVRNSANPKGVVVKARVPLVVDSQRASQDRKEEVIPA